jgi:hypothetical protein
MVRSNLALAILSSLTTAFAAAAGPSQTTIFSLPGPPLPGAWFENLALRPNGNILATRGDAPEIWQIDPDKRTGSLLVSVPGAFNLTGISAVGTGNGGGKGKGKGKGKDGELYIFGSAHIPAPMQIEPGSGKVWRLEITDAGPSVGLVRAMPDAGFINGIVGFDKGRVLMSDTVREVIYLMDVETGEFTTPFVGMEGVNGVRVAGEFVYWANHNAQTVSRVAVDGNAVPTGAKEVVVTNQVDDFALEAGKDGKVEKVYLATMTGNEIVEVVLGTGQKRVVASDLSGTGTGFSSSVVLGRGKGNEKVLYAAVGQAGEGSTAEIVAVTL